MYKLSRAKFKSVSSKKSNAEEINKASTHGFVEYTLVDAETNEIVKQKRFNNFISSAAKMATLVNYMGSTLMSDVVMYERYMVLTQINRRYTGSEAASFGYIGGKAKVYNTLLNLDATQRAALSSDNASLLPHSQTDYINTNVVGYAAKSVIPAANGKEGASDWAPSNHAKDRNKIVKQWSYDTNAANGTINAVGMINAAVLDDESGFGTAVYECFDKTQLDNTNFVSGTTRVCPPGITGFTDDDEILLNYSYGGVSMHKRKLSTAETTDITDATQFFVLPENTVDYLIIGNYLYALTGVAVVSDNFNPMNFYLKVFDMTNGCTQVANFKAAETYGSYNYIGKAALFYDGVKLWVTVVFKYSDNGNCLIEISSNGTYFNAVAAAYTDYTQLGITFPTWLDNPNNMCIGHYGTSYVIYVLAKFERRGNTDPVGLDIYNAIIFTDKTSVGTTITKIVSGVPLFAIPCKGTDRSGWISTNGILHNQGTNYIGESKVDECTLQAQYMNDNGNMTSYEFCRIGAWFLDDTLGSTVNNIVDISSDPITKTDTQKLFITYGDYVE